MTTPTNIARCLNLDWFEIYCIELSNGYPHDVDYFRRAGFQVNDRGYGTRIYEQMFTLYDIHGEPWLEIRRQPKSISTTGENSVIDPYACHLRLVNRYCYAPQAVFWLMEFLRIHHFDFRKIYRVDLCLDFEKFDYGDKPADFVRRYMRHTYVRNARGELMAHAHEKWDSLGFNSLKWGAPSSAVSVKLYNKSEELRVVKDKPWIRQAWAAAGLVDDVVSMCKQDENGTIYYPEIWRLEFSIKSGNRQWVTVKNNTDTPNKYQSLRNTPDIYMSQTATLTMFTSLVAQFFSFRYYVREFVKADCPPKKLFKFNDSVLYKLSVPLADIKAEDIAVPSWLQRLSALLLKYRSTTINPEIYSSCATLIKDISERIANKQAQANDKNTQILLQQLLTLSMQHAGIDLQAARDFLSNLLSNTDAKPF